MKKLILIPLIIINLNLQADWKPFLANGISFLSALSDNHIVYFGSSFVAHACLDNPYLTKDHSFSMKVEFDPMMAIRGYDQDFKTQGYNIRTTFTIPLGRFDIGTNYESFREIDYKSWSVISNYTWRNKNIKNRSYIVSSGLGLGKTDYYFSPELNNEIAFNFDRISLTLSTSIEYRELSNKYLVLSNYIGVKFII